jgi:hypothetical protein
VSAQAGSPAGPPGATCIRSMLTAPPTTLAIDTTTGTPAELARAMHGRHHARQGSHERSTLLPPRNAGIGSRLPDPCTSPAACSVPRRTAMRLADAGRECPPSRRSVLEQSL